LIALTYVLVDRRADDRFYVGVTVTCIVRLAGLGDKWTHNKLL